VTLIYHVNIIYITYIYAYEMEYFIYPL